MDDRVFELQLIAEFSAKQDGKKLFDELRSTAIERGLHLRTVVSGYRGWNPRILAEIEARGQQKNSRYIYITSACSDPECLSGCQVCQRIVRLGDHRGGGRISVQLVFGVDPNNADRVDPVMRWMSTAKPFGASERQVPDPPGYRVEDDSDWRDDIEDSDEDWADDDEDCTEEDFG